MEECTTTLDPDDAMNAAISGALRILLSDKHLYQSVQVDTTVLDQIAKYRREQSVNASHSPGASFYPPSVKTIRDELNSHVDCPWFPDDVGFSKTSFLTASRSDAQVFNLPTITTTCNTCKQWGPFNAVAGSEDTSTRSPVDQWFLFSYQCQHSKCEPIRFLVRRSGTKLTLSGRDPFEVVTVEQCIPKIGADFFRNAVIAFQAGQTLAALFLMRVFIEQFWRSQPEVASSLVGKPRPTGDEMGDAYKRTLPEDFKSRFPTLAEVYSELSEAMHSARADVPLFLRSRDLVIRHFQARKLFEL